MVSRLFLVYVVVELAVVVALASTIGLGWTLVLLLVGMVVGLALAGSQLKGLLTRLRSDLSTTPSRAATDGALVALATTLVVIPGLVTTAAGLLLLLPPTRAAARPMLTAMAARHAPLITVTRRPQRVYIDGEVIDVTDVKPPALPGPQ
ncbi:MAG: FxsA family protein [Mycobacterium sp.]|nr:FxsA family protein [Mycobacterium sp.]MBV9722211.1 FxsA family protein [Mycobacterium sp.]